MTDKLNGRRVYLPQGQDPIKDLNALADAIAGSDADLFAQGSQIVWLKDTGELVGVGRDALLEIIAKYVVVKQLVRGTTDKPSWKVEFCPVQPDETTLRALLKGEGSLAGRLPKAPSEPVRLTPQQQREVQYRLKTGEPKGRIADAYGVDISTIRELAAQ